MTTVLRAPSPTALVDHLTAPTGADRVDTTRLSAALVARLSRDSMAGARRLDAYGVEHGARRFATPFRWTARAARRPLGTAALRRVAEGKSRDLLDAAADEVDAVCDRARRGLARRGALGTWLASEPREVRALCVTEATTWAAGVWQLVDLDAHDDRVRAGIPDAWFEVPGARTTLHGRRDAESVSTDGQTGGLLRVRDGAPGSRAIDGLVVDGLVASMAGGGARTHARVVGAWPDAGVCVSVELDDDALRRAARLLVAGVTVVTLPVPLAQPAAA